MQNETNKVLQAFSSQNSNEDVKHFAGLWAIEQIKNISDPKEATQKFKELQQAFVENY